MIPDVVGGDSPNLVAMIPDVFGDPSWIIPDGFGDPSWILGHKSSTLLDELLPDDRSLSFSAEDSTLLCELPTSIVSLKLLLLSSGIVVHGF